MHLANKEYSVEWLKGDLRNARQQMDETLKKIARSKARQNRAREKIEAQETEASKTVEQQERNVVRRATSQLEETIRREIRDQP